MKKAILSLLVFLSLLSLASPWGFFAHKRINRLAVFTLPSPLIGFYKQHIDFITEHAVDADKRRYSNSKEASRHYIDADFYGISHIPRKWKDAVEKYSEDTLQAYGILPWHIERMTYYLTEAFKEKDKDKIVQLSADLGHYLADACVPLHTTENYNGQLTSQHGIHAFWESRLPELFADNYDYFTANAIYIENPLAEAWKLVEESHRALDSVLIFERELNKSFSADGKYGFESKGRQTGKVYSREYSEGYHLLLNGMVERRMKRAILAIGSFWYTAWVNAGQPDMKELKGAGNNHETEEKSMEEEKQYLNGTILGRPEQ